MWVSLVLPARETPNQFGERLAPQTERLSRTACPLFQPTDHELGEVGSVPHEERREGRAPYPRDRRAGGGPRDSQRAPYDLTSSQSTVS